VPNLEDDKNCDQIKLGMFYFQAVLPLEIVSKEVLVSEALSQDIHGRTFFFFAMAKI
jgi:hypothetical protein